MLLWIQQHIIQCKSTITMSIHSSHPATPSYSLLAGSLQEGQLRGSSFHLSPNMAQHSLVLHEAVAWFGHTLCHSGGLSTSIVLFAAKYWYTKGLRCVHSSAEEKRKEILDPFNGAHRTASPLCASEKGNISPRMTVMPQFTQNPRALTWFKGQHWWGWRVYCVIHVSFTSNI